MEQTVYLGSSTTDVVVYTQAISSSGSHVALVVNTSTSKLVFADGTVSSATPTVASLGTGKAKVTFASIANSSLSAGDTVAVRINGTADGVAFSEYMIPVFIATASSGGGGSSLTQADIRTAVGLASANLDTQLGDIPTVTEFNARTKPTADYFDHTADQVAVSAVNDKTGYSLATAPPTAAEVYAEFTSGSNEDVFKADVSGLSTFDASTDQVVASNMRGTDNAILASSAPTNWGSLSINSSGHITRVTLVDTTTTNTDMVDVSSLATSADLATVDGNVDAIKLKTDQLTFTVSNQVDSNALTGGGGDDAATIYSYFTASNREDVFHTDVSALSTSAEIAALNDISVNDVWDASLSSHNVGGSTGKALRQIKEGVISIEGSVNDLSATTTTFISNLSETTDGYYHDKVIVFISGSLLGQARHIETYTGSTKSITVSQAFTSAPSNGDEFLILATHEHSLNEISDAVWSDTQSSYTVDGTFGYYLDSQVSQAGAGGSGLYQLTVNVTDASSGAALQGARINVDGTTLTLTTDSAGQCVFNLDSGVYLLTISPPAGYDTVSANTVTITTADASSSFSLSETASSGDCDVPWVG